MVPTLIKPVQVARASSESWTFSTTVTTWAVGERISRDPLGVAGGLNAYEFCFNSPLNYFDPDGMYPGQMPPAPPGSWNWTPGQWDSGRFTLIDPEGNIWTAHPEDRRHWRHWDRQDPKGKDQGRWPDNSKRPWPKQKKLKCDQSESDPSGDAPEWQPPSMNMSPFAPFMPLDPLPIGVPSFAPAPVPIRLPFPVPVFP